MEKKIILNIKRLLSIKERIIKKRIDSDRWLNYNSSFYIIEYQKKDGRIRVCEIKDINNIIYKTAKQGKNRKSHKLISSQSHIRKL
jgi:hypothetical protein